MSETQTAECRSSKPDVAGSIPVAHSKFRRVVSIGKTSVSKTEVFSSNLNAPANMILDFGFWIADITYKIVDYLLLKFEKIDDR